MTARYTRTAVALHWLIALLIFSAFPIGYFMPDLPLTPFKLRMYSYHKWIGVMVFLVAVIRVCWRATHRPPPLPDSVPNWEKLAAHATHLALYVLIFAIPVSGWLMSSALGFQTVLFEVLPLPDLVGKNKELAHLLHEVHEALNYTLLVLVVGHIGASFKHHFIDRDDILVRMVPFLERK